MTDEERQLHLLIRTMTVHTFRPLNQSLLEWLRADRYFRAVSPSDRRLGGLALVLAQLEAHLVLWVAKYEAWIPQHPEHALVFLADEERHGVGFPKGRDEHSGGIAWPSAPTTGEHRRGADACWFVHARGAVGTLSGIADEESGRQDPASDRSSREQAEAGRGPAVGAHAGRDDRLCSIEQRPVRDTARTRTRGSNQITATGTGVNDLPLNISGGH